MRRATLYVILAYVMTSVFVSCYQSHKKELDLAYALAKSNPDSALVFLNHIDQVKLSEEDMAKYALTYYMAQDKSGLDVDNDSLIRIAYDWYEKNQDDSLYASCLDYMGKYFMLNDSLEQAKVCLEKSYNLANKKGDISASVMDKLVLPFRFLFNKNVMMLAFVLAFSVCSYGMWQDYILYTNNKMPLLVVSIVFALGVFSRVHLLLSKGFNVCSGIGYGKQTWLTFEFYKNGESKRHSLKKYLPWDYISR